MLIYHDKTFKFVNGEHLAKNTFNDINFERGLRIVEILKWLNYPNRSRSDL